MFDGEESATAVIIPLFYGLVEVVMISIFCIACWKAGWTFAPSDENILKVITGNYQPGLNVIVGGDQGGKMHGHKAGTKKNGFTYEFICKKMSSSIHPLQMDSSKLQQGIEFSSLSVDSKEHKPEISMSPRKRRYQENDSPRNDDATC